MCLKDLKMINEQLIEVKKMEELTKEQFLKRCETIYDLGFARKKILSLLYEWVDAVLRLEGSQVHYWIDFLVKEKARTKNFSNVLARDKEYALCCLTAILDHPCQQCAEDRDAWHTRSSFCNHKKKEEE